MEAPTTPPKPRARLGATLRHFEPAPQTGSRAKLLSLQLYSRGSWLQKNAQPGPLGLLHPIQPQLAICGSFEHLPAINKHGREPLFVVVRGRVVFQERSLPPTPNPSTPNPPTPQPPIPPTPTNPPETPAGGCQLMPLSDTRFSSAISCKTPPGSFSGKTGAPLDGLVQKRYKGWSEQA